MTQRERLFTEIQRQQEAGGQFPLVSLEDFFDSNDDFGSIGCNLDMPAAPSVPTANGWLRRLLSPKLAIQAAPPSPHWPHPGPQGFYVLLRAVRERPEVQDVLVEINDLNVGEGNWPFSERVYILTTASLEEVKAWTSDIFPTEVSKGYSDEKPRLAPELLPGYQAFTLWWD